MHCKYVFLYTHAVYHIYIYTYTNYNIPFSLLVIACPSITFPTERREAIISLVQDAKARGRSVRRLGPFSKIAGERIFIYLGKIMVSKGNHPQMAARFRLVNYYNLPRSMLDGCLSMVYGHGPTNSYDMALFHDI